MVRRKKVWISSLSTFKWIITHLCLPTIICIFTQLTVYMSIKLWPGQLSSNECGSAIWNEWTFVCVSLQILVIFSVRVNQTMTKSHGLCQPLSKKAHAFHNGNLQLAPNYFWRKAHGSTLLYLSCSHIFDTTTIKRGRVRHHLFSLKMHLLWLYEL